MRNAITPNTFFDELFRDLNRVAIGFEPTIRRLHDVQNTISPSSTGYPPYDLEMIGDDHYRITLAVAGFNQSDLVVETHDNQLIISGEKIDKQEDRQFIHRSIANRSFKRVFHLADHVRIEDAKLENGLLTVDLFREVPEALKPRKIEISGPKVIDAKN